MKEYTFKIVLNKDFVIEKMDDDMLPIKNLRSFLEAKLSPMKILKEDYTTLEFAYDCEKHTIKDVADTVKEAFLKRYSIVLENDISKYLDCYCKEGEDKRREFFDFFKVGSAGDKKDDGNSGKSKEDKNESDDEFDREIEKLLDRIQKRAEEVLDDDEFDDDDEDEDKKDLKEDKQEQPPAESKDKITMKKIQQLVGAKEFKELADEFVKIAPMIRNSKSKSAFLSRAYLFSVNDGYGYSTYLELFAELLTGLEICETSSCIAEAALVLPKNDKTDEEIPIEGIGSAKRSMSRGVMSIYSVNMSEWMSKIDSPIFRRYLMRLSKMSKDVIVIFRIPFVDKEIKDKVKRALNDVFFIKDISIPPFSVQELRMIAQRQIAEYDYTMAKSAWDNFDERIKSEKKDGRFYGIRTVKKIVNELVYKKLYKNAVTGRTSATIGKEDSKLLCLDMEKELGYEQLTSLIGCEGIKGKLDEMISQIEYTRKVGGFESMCMHMRFVGNPGTGKTTVARIVGKILKDKGLLSHGNFYEYAGRDLCGKYIGHTAPRTAGICRDAYGSVLFIDEAYSLYRGDKTDKDFGREALDTLIAEMENNRSNLVVIMAGYTDEMETLMQGNVGLASRMPYMIEFPNFTKEQLYEIFKLQIKGKLDFDDDLLPAVKEYFDSLSQSFINSKEFSNARYVRNIFERTLAKAAMRCQIGGIDKVRLMKRDFDAAICDKEFSHVEKKRSRIGF